MAQYVEVGGQKTYWKFKNTEPETLMVDGVFHREISSRYGPQFEFENDDGSIHVLPAAGQLKYKMDFVSPGDRVKIIYKGEEILENGAMKGRPAHQFTVLRAEPDSHYSDDNEAVDEDDGLPEFDDGLPEFDDL